MPGFVAPTGPPAVGKTTLSAQLAAHHGAQVFRLREYAHAYQCCPEADPALFTTGDLLGWFPDQTVRVVLESALLDLPYQAVNASDTPTDCLRRVVAAFTHARLLSPLSAKPFDQIMATLTTWRQMGGSKLTILGGEPTLHPDYVKVIRYAKRLGYEHVITTSSGLEPAIRKFRRMTPEDFAYVQISLDGGSPDSHDRVRGTGTFDEAVRNVRELVERGFDTRIISAVNRANAGDCLRLVDLADEIGASLVKFHVFSVIGSGHGAAEWGMQPWSGSSSTSGSKPSRLTTGPASGTSRSTPAASAWPDTPPTATAAARSPDRASAGRCSTTRTGRSSWTCGNTWCSRTA